MPNPDPCPARHKHPTRPDTFWQCRKKRGHHLKAGKYARQHVDSKNSPPKYWEWEVICTVTSCGELVDPYSTQYEPDALQLCDLHYSEYLDNGRLHPNAT